MIKINEIFYSIQGESSYAGLPTVFIRTSGCNLRCTYCDTTYAYYQGHEMALENIVDEIEGYKTRFVCVTGGEPLLQKQIYNLMTTLCDLNYKVSLETSGSKSCEAVDPRVKIILDVKTPDSGEGHSFLMENLEYINPNTEIKFVICSIMDFNWAEDFIKSHKLDQNHSILYSPSFNEVDAKWLAEKILRENSPARLQLQLHKYIWSASSRGV